jgi:hypothetical protein
MNEGVPSPVNGDLDKFDPNPRSVAIFGCQAQRGQLHL